MQLTQLLRSGGTPLSPRPLLPTFGASPASGCMMWPGRFLKQGARLSAPSAPGGCLAPPPPRRDAGRARPGAGAAGSGWGLPALPAPLRLGSPRSPGAAVRGPPPAPPAPPGPGCHLRGAGGYSGPWPYSPRMAPDRLRGFSPGGSIQVFLKYGHLARFSEAKSVGLALCCVGTSLSRRSCLHLETPLNNYVCVDLPQRGRQQARHWDRNAASVQFGYFLDFLVILFMGLLLKRVGLCSIILW